MKRMSTGASALKSRLSMGDQADASPPPLLIGVRPAALLLAGFFMSDAAGKTDLARPPIIDIEIRLIAQSFSVSVFPVNA
jgi:hypothetical protein